MTPQYEQCDPGFGETEIQSRAKKQAALLQHFWSRWRHEYLTGLREFHQASAPNIQVVKPEAVVLVHDDTPRINWRFAVVEDTIAGEDGLVRAANIRTSTGRTNRPVSKLYPLEVTVADPLLKQDSSQIPPNKSVNSSDGAGQTERQEELQDPLVKPLCEGDNKSQNGDNKSQNGYNRYADFRRMSRTSNITIYCMV